MRRQVVLLRVGIDSGCGRSQGPLFEDGTFEFMCIPDKLKVSAHTYGNLVGKHGNILADFFPEQRREAMSTRHIHLDPEFETFTYGDPRQLKRSLRKLKQGDYLVFYCGLQKWDAKSGWDHSHRPALYLAGYFQVTYAGLATDFTEEVLRREFGNNFHVRHPTVYKQQKDILVLVKGGQGSRLFHKACQISAEGKDRTGKRLKILSPSVQKIFGDFGGRNSIQRCPPRWVDDAFVDKAIDYIKELE